MSKDRIEKIIEAGTAENTHRAHAGDMKYFWAWARVVLDLDPAYPVPDDAVIRFITDHLDGLDPEHDKILVAAGVKRRRGPHAVATVERRLASLSYAHQKRGIEDAENPCKGGRVRLVMSKSKAARAKAGDRPKVKRAITKKLLDEMLATFGNSLTDTRDKAILLFAFGSGGRRRSEVAEARLDDLDAVRGGFIYTLARSKTDQGGRGHRLPIRGTAKKALAAWLRASKITDGYLFRAIHRGKITDQPITPETVVDIVKERVERCGRNPRHYAGHSLRRGFVTEAGRQGVPIRDVMQMTTHKTVAVVIGYHEDGEIMNNPGGSILD
jgi:integrase